MITQKQYENWKDFSTRMARVCFKRRRRPGWKEILDNVLSFFQCLDPHDWPCIVNWDISEPYSEGSDYYSRTCRMMCPHCRGQKKIDCPYHCEEGRIYRYARPLSVASLCNEMEETWNPYYWDDSSEHEVDRRQEQFCVPVLCCIRAGLNLAVARSAGVLGFTAGDLRRMYPEGVPDWVTGGKDYQWSYGCNEKVNATFAEMTDTQALFL